MNYKDLIKSRNVRIKIMQFLSFIPDELMLKLQYRIKIGRKLNLKNPQRYTEKLQWYKLNYRDYLMAQCADKYDVRKYVEDCGLGYILNEIYGVYDSPDDIDFNVLPNEFVVKDTLGGGGNSVIIVSDKSQMDENKMRKQMQDWVDEPINKKHPGREWVYDGRKHRIIVEKYIEHGKEKAGLIDYKFYCFEGKCEYVLVIANRVLGKSVTKGIFSRNYELLPYRYVEDEDLCGEFYKPDNYENMIEFAEKLSKPFPHARIDLYNINGHIVFGEITFFPASGYLVWEPDDFDYILGKKFVLPK